MTGTQCHLRLPPALPTRLSRCRDRRPMRRSREVLGAALQVRSTAQPRRFPSCRTPVITILRAGAETSRLGPPCPVTETARIGPSPVRTCNFRKIRTTWTSRLVPTALSAPVRMAVRLAASARRLPGCPVRATRALRGPRFHARRRSPVATGMALLPTFSRRVCTPCPLRDSPGLPRPTRFLPRSFRHQTLGRVRRRI